MGLNTPVFVLHSRIFFEDHCRFAAVRQCGCVAEEIEDQGLLEELIVGEVKANPFKGGHLAKNSHCSTVPAQHW